MNPKCPECQTELSEDFGIVTCSNCGSVCSVDLDGNAEVQEKIESSQEGLNLQEEEISSGEEGPDFSTAVDENLESEPNDFFENEEESSDLEGVSEETGQIEEDLLESNEAPVEEQQASDFEEDLDAESDQKEQEYEDDLESEEEPLSSEGFFANLELFTEQLKPQDHHHTYYQLKVFGFETKTDLEEVLDLTLDDYLGLTKEKLTFDEGNQSFTIPKISFLRLVALHKRLSTLGFLSMEWTLIEDQSDIIEENYENEGASEVSEPESDEDKILYGEVDESDFD